MDRQYERDTQRPAPPVERTVLDEIEERNRKVAADQAEEARRHAELDAQRNQVAADEAALQEGIDRVLSSSPEDFVMRFIQTEGQ